MLFDALVTGDCVICLQPLVEVSASQRTPEKEGRRSHDARQSVAASALSPSAQAAPPSVSRDDVGSPRFLPTGAVPRSLSSSSTRTGFHIGYAPGVLRQYDSTDIGSASSSSGSLATANTHTTETVRRIHDVTLLPCGHGFFHYGCILQLYEYSSPSKCPVCRAPIHSMNDLIPFKPRTRPSQLAVARLADNAREFGGVQRAVQAPHHSTGKVGIDDEEEDTREDTHTRVHDVVVHPDGEVAGRKRQRRSDSMEAHSSHTCGPGVATDTSLQLCSDDDDEPDDVKDQDEDDVKDQDDEIMLVGSRQVDPSEAYCGLLERIARQYEERAATVHDRSTKLYKSLKELEEDCAALQVTQADCRRRRELLGDRGDGRQLIELRRACAETRSASESVARELASAVRENAELQRQIDKFHRKSERL